MNGERFRGSLLGLACGDAVGTTVEFRSRGSFPEVTDMVGGGPFGLRAGEWTDDTSMALCLATSLVETGGFDPVDQMRRYVRWADEGYLSSNGRCFDIGTTVAGALGRFKRSGEPFSGSTDPFSAGNGCIMRLAPVPMFFHRDPERALDLAVESARTTHGAPACLEASRLFAAILLRALEGADREEILFDHDPADFQVEPIMEIAAGDYQGKTRQEIRGSGYVVHSLEAALWCFLTTDSFEAAILRAANLGEDADTTAAVCGQVAGAYYGEQGIPEAWRRTVVMADEIGVLAERLHAG